MDEKGATYYPDKLRGVSMVGGHTNSQTEGNPVGSSEHENSYLQAGHGV